MQALLFYATYPLVLLVAWLPFPLLYAFSDMLFWVLWWSGYRKKVVFGNLQRSFPEKSPEEIRDLGKKYYRYLCDLMLETFKTMRMTHADIEKRSVFIPNPELDKLAEEGQSFIIVMGHYGNWEWAGPGFSIACKHTLVVIYRPLSNEYFERMLYKMRTRHGTLICPVKNTLRDMVAHQKELRATAFVADQTASKKDAYWTTFLNQETAVFTGPEKLAKKFKLPVVYMSVQRPKRGYYTISAEILFRDPALTAENEIMERFTQRLEQDIINNPAIWLWSHRRWKHKRNITPDNSENAISDATA